MLQQHLYKEKQTAQGIPKKHSLSTEKCYSHYFRYLYIGGDHRGQWEYDKFWQLTDANRSIIGIAPNAKMNLKHSKCFSATLVKIIENLLFLDARQ